MQQQQRPVLPELPRLGAECLCSGRLAHTPWLTLNLGVRYDLFTPYTDAHGQMSNFNSTLGIMQSPALVGLYHGSNTDDIKTDYSNIAPRFGFSASLKHQMVVRGGFGVSYFTNEEGGGTDVSMANFPYTWSTDYGGDNYQVPVPAGMAWDQTKVTNGYTNCSKATAKTSSCAINMAAGITEPFVSADTVAALPGGTEIDGVSNDLKSGRLFQYSLEIQKEFGANVVAIGYIGNQGRHLPQVPNTNQAVFVDYDANYVNSDGSKGAYLQGPSPYYNTNFSAAANAYTENGVLDKQLLQGDSIFMTSSSSTSNYNAMQATFTRRLSHGLAANINYTWAKAMNNGSPQGEGGNRPVECVRAGCLMDLGNGTSKTISGGANEYDYGLGDINIAHRVAGTANYELPFGKNLNGPAGYAVKGWNANIIVVWNTSLPESIGENGPTNISGITGWRGGDAPNLVASMKGPKTKSEWFNVNAFVAQTPYLLGNAKRNVLADGPHQRHADMGLSKDFPLYEAMKLQFRAEAFNLTNTPNLGLPGSGLGGPTYDTITSVNGNSRLFQFALRLSY